MGQSHHKRHEEDAVVNYLSAQVDALKTDLRRHMVTCDMRYFLDDILNMIKPDGNVQLNKERTRIRNILSDESERIYGENNIIARGVDYLCLDVCKSEEFVIKLKEINRIFAPIFNKPESKEPEKKRRPNIPKTLRMKVWEKRNGNNINGKCYCCDKTLSFVDVECGHVISVKDGGATNFDNLEPVCSACNRGMGTENLETFKNSLK